MEQILTASKNISLCSGKPGGQNTSLGHPAVSPAQEILPMTEVTRHGTDLVDDTLPATNNRDCQPVEENNKDQATFIVIR